MTRWEELAINSRSRRTDAGDEGGGLRQLDVSVSKVLQARRRCHDLGPLTAQLYKEHIFTPSFSSVEIEVAQPSRETVHLDGIVVRMTLPWLLYQMGRPISVRQSLQFERLKLFCPLRSRYAGIPS